MSNSGADATTPPQRLRRFLFQNQAIVGCGGKIQRLRIGHHHLRAICEKTEGGITYILWKSCGKVETVTQMERDRTSIMSSYKCALCGVRDDGRVQARGSSEGSH